MSILSHGAEWDRASITRGNEGSGFRSNRTSRALNRLIPQGEKGEKMSAILKFNYELQTVECADCSLVFAISGEFIAKRRRDHSTWYCPSGHSNYYPDKSDIEKLQNQLAQKERSLEWERARATTAEKNAEHTERRLRATKAVVTKTKQRIARGKCPRCSHTFVDLEKHMTNQHPDYCKGSQ